MDVAGDHAPQAHRPHFAAPTHLGDHRTISDKTVPGIGGGPAPHQGGGKPFQGRKNQLTGPSPGHSRDFQSRPENLVYGVLAADSKNASMLLALRTSAPDEKRGPVKKIRRLKLPLRLRPRPILRKN